MNADTLPKAVPKATPTKAPSKRPQPATPVKSATPAKSLHTPVKRQNPASVATIQTPTPNAKQANRDSQGTLPKPAHHARAKSGSGGDFTYARTKDSEFYLKLRSSQIDHDPRRTEEESEFYHKLRSTQIQDQVKHTQDLDQ